MGSSAGNAGTTAIDRNSLSVLSIVHQDYPRRINLFPQSCLASINL
jgi:hypothetical protein